MKRKKSACGYPIEMGSTIRLAEPGRGGRTPYPPYLPGMIVIAANLPRCTAFQHLEPLAYHLVAERHGLSTFSGACDACQCSVAERHSPRSSTVARRCTPAWISSSVSAA